MYHNSILVKIHPLKCYFFHIVVVTYKKIEC